MKCTFEYWADLQAANQFDKEEAVVIALRKIIEEVNKSAVTVFFMHESKNLAPVITWSILNTLKEKGILVEGDGNYSSSGPGFATWLLKNRNAIFNEAKINLSSVFCFPSEIDDNPPDISQDLIDSFPLPAT